MQSSELLYARRTPEADFEGRVKCDVRIQVYREEGFIDFDTTSFRLIDANPERQGRTLLKKHTFALDTGAVYRLLITTSDMNRRVEDFTTIEVLKAPFATREDYLIYKNDQEYPLFGDDVKVGDKLRVTTQRGETLMRYFSWDPELKLPPPPFTEVMVPTPQLPPTAGTSFIAGGLPILVDGPLFTVTTNQGAHIFTLRAHDGPFPSITKLDDMVESLRYISSRREYEKIVDSRYPKKELDAFWLDCGGSKERTRTLIGIYYSRVEEANYYFSSIVAGWRTDRGLVHVIFGNPNRIRSTADYETWIYGEENNLSSVVFNFRRINTPISRNHYILERNPLYRTDWDRAVTSWRNGRIFQE
jgi:GWxTD domain-containing protein